MSNFVDVSGPNLKSINDEEDVEVELDDPNIHEEEDDEVTNDLTENLKDCNVGESEVKSDIKSLPEVAIGTSPLYCPICTMPPEYCEYGPTYDQCLPWILQNCPEVLNADVLAKATGTGDAEDEEKDGEGETKKKKKRGGASVPKKKAAPPEMKVIIARVQRQKRKYVTAVSGLETVPDLKLKDAARVFGRKFSSGSSISETATGAKEIVIQGDVLFDLPDLLLKEFKVPKSCIFIMDEGGGSIRPCE